MSFAWKRNSPSHNLYICLYTQSKTLSFGVTYLHFNFSRLCIFVYKLYICIQIYYFFLSIIRSSQTIKHFLFKNKLRKREEVAAAAVLWVLVCVCVTINQQRTDLVCVPTLSQRNTQHMIKYQIPKYQIPNTKYQIPKYQIPNTRYQPTQESAPAKV